MRVVFALDGLGLPTAWDGNFPWMNSQIGIDAELLTG